MYECNPKDWDAQVKENAEKMSHDEFISWFDGGGTISGAYEKSQDIWNRLINPIVRNQVKNPAEKTCLDVGYAHGGLTACASKAFQHAYGVEWHDQADVIGPYLESLDHGNVYLVHSPEGINMQDDSVDFLYSWLYVNRLGTIAGVQSFLSECYRVMKDHAVGVIFFPRYIRTGKAQSVKDYEGDVIAENADKKGYREGGVTTRVRGISIIVALWKMKEMLKKAGFNILGQTASYDGKGRGKVYHGQHGLIFRKGDEEPEEKAQEPKSGDSERDEDTQQKAPTKKTTRKKTTRKKSQLKKRK
ncbi:MAG: hypothetical protein AM326_07200 [Candidatus Thorarchaeota archaeon SMTZ-45]|nr:MAG: hypothetical protein AM326_07200 [Candidatus Thorarchaeota archaeon SMTZ-45]